MTERMHMFLNHNARSNCCNAPIIAEILFGDPNRMDQTMGWKWKCCKCTNSHGVHFLEDGQRDEWSDMTEIMEP